MRSGGCARGLAAPPANFCGPSGTVQNRASTECFGRVRSAQISVSFDQLLECGVRLGAQLRRELVMLAGVFLVGRLLGREDDGEVEMGVGILRIEGGRGLEFLLRRFLPALLARGDAEIVVRR